MLRNDEAGCWQTGAELIEPEWTAPPQKPISEPKPFLRWAGGKTRLLKAILPHVPQRFQTYHEPFLGSGAVFFAVRTRALAGQQLGDLNNELINIWNVIRIEPNKFLDALGRYDGCNDEAAYYRIRSQQVEGAVERAARFFYLNQTAWNGLWRVNRWGVFNVPWGDRPFRGIDRAELLAASNALKNTKIHCEDFRSSLAHACAGDFVYLDPPYLPVSDTSKFSGYTEKRFRHSDLVELAALTRELSARGVDWVMSNRDTPVVRELFGHGRIERFTTWRAVSAQNRRNVQPAASPEVVVVGSAQ
jgi:DNA adenine methylase